ncbi:MAG: hypothetical protein A2365_00495 [Candidatus Nealsonbacteria bacterium RIFOXYB1_FULL_40_15]|uniref:UDP-glucose/GDP-mannose dehydrogenase dimerisation domain-containing protein n=2 Tax=Candidatus Nealsoniibacteriota TaxID=1817911 RepID=A0A1G2ESJ0_9BACT|nr:MAG: hypothetical protein A2365_00495 [Candidatus Nealsonbacteria bacterium RIFOXYB1_FULL_40_15]OGZ28749.1 MAG: hypothetical protein A2427_01675 [Candidatus Nealsonbacteria bacterium RIFOXYC1_FULL_40_7]OGZ29028.1 MAG: hypothetical protein A2562_00925 [Candidatus Nealsonbacteria bacterium RIFOXYD1_FULL_39_11]
MDKNVGILGFGEIGKAIAEIYRLSGITPKIKDLNRDDSMENLGVLNICIPYSASFVKIVKKQIKKSNPDLVIVHSTVKIGTVRRIGPNAVHSPVRGVHPDLVKGIKTFVKYIGADSKETGETAEKHLRKIGLKTRIMMPSETTEALKLWDTTQYGWMIVLNKEIKKWCDKKGLDFEKVYREANRSYNEGYGKLGRPEVARPCLKYMPGKIGGHCVIPNCELLDSKIAKLILEENKKCAE